MKAEQNLGMAKLTASVAAAGIRRRLSAAFSVAQVIEGEIACQPLQHHPCRRWSGR